MPWQYLKAQLDTSHSGSAVRVNLPDEDGWPNWQDANDLGEQGYEMVGLVKQFGDCGADVAVFKRFVSEESKS